MEQSGSNSVHWRRIPPCLGTGCHRHVETDGIRSLNRKLMKSRKNLKLEDFDHVKSFDKTLKHLKTLLGSLDLGAFFIKRVHKNTPTIGLDSMVIQES